jgi:thiamine-phosphate pyrophosphorylase
VKGYYFITDHDLSVAGLKSDAENAVAAGAKIIQYRNKKADTRTLYNEALLIKKICSGSRSFFIINDRIDIALAVDAHGVHIGQEDMPYQEARRLLGKDKIIGVTVHNMEEALLAEAWGANYLGVSPIFTTATKLDAGKPCGVEGLIAIRQACRLPIVAIGGIDLSNVGIVIKAGADMVCVISAVITKPDVAAEIQKFQKEFGL